MTHETQEQHVERLTVERGYDRKDWGFRSGVRDGLDGDYGGMCNPDGWPGYDEGFAAGQEVINDDILEMAPEEILEEAKADGEDTDAYAERMDAWLADTLKGFPT